MFCSKSSKSSLKKKLDSEIAELAELIAIFDQDQSKILPKKLEEHADKFLVKLEDMAISHIKRATREIYNSYANAYEVDNYANNLSILAGIRDFCKQPLKYQTSFTYTQQQQERSQQITDQCNRAITILQKNHAIDTRYTNLATLLIYTSAVLIIASLVFSIMGLPQISLPLWLTGMVLMAIGQGLATSSSMIFRNTYRTLFSPILSCVGLFTPKLNQTAPKARLEQTQELATGAQKDQIKQYHSIN